MCQVGESFQGHNWYLIILFIDTFMGYEVILSQHGPAIENAMLKAVLVWVQDPQKHTASAKILLSLPDVFCRSSKGHLPSPTLSNLTFRLYWVALLVKVV